MAVEHGRIHDGGLRSLVRNLRENGATPRYTLVYLDKAQVHARLPSSPLGVPLLVQAVIRRVIIPRAAARGALRRSALIEPSSRAPSKGSALPVKRS